MMRWIYVYMMGVFCVSGLAQADSINLFNDASYPLQAVIYDANGDLMGEFVLNPRDATEWSNNDMNFGTMPRFAFQSPYSVEWSCLGGKPYGSCNNVAAGTTVTAQGCGGDQECGEGDE